MMNRIKKAYYNYKNESPLAESGVFKAYRGSPIKGASPTDLPRRYFCKDPRKSVVAYVHNFLLFQGFYIGVPIISSLFLIYCIDSYWLLCFNKELLVVEFPIFHGWVDQETKYWIHCYLETFSNLFSTRSSCINLVSYFYYWLFNSVTFSEQLILDIFLLKQAIFWSILCFLGLAYNILYAIYRLLGFEFCDFFSGLYMGLIVYKILLLYLCSMGNFFYYYWLCFLTKAFSNAIILGSILAWLKLLGCLHYLYPIINVYYLAKLARLKYTQGYWNVGHFRRNAYTGCYLMPPYWDLIKKNIRSTVGPTLVFTSKSFFLRIIRSILFRVPLKKSFTRSFLYEKAYLTFWEDTSHVKILSDWTVDSIYRLQIMHNETYHDKSTLQSLAKMGDIPGIQLPANIFNRWVIFCNSLYNIFLDRKKPLISPRAQKEGLFALWIPWMSLRQPVEPQQRLQEVLQNYTQYRARDTVYQRLRAGYLSLSIYPVIRLVSFLLELFTKPYVYFTRIARHFGKKNAFLKGYSYDLHAYLHSSANWQDEHIYNVLGQIRDLPVGEGKSVKQVLLGALTDKEFGSLDLRYKPTVRRRLKQERFRWGLTKPFTGFSQSTIKNYTYFNQVAFSRDSIYQNSVYNLLSDMDQKQDESTLKVYTVTNRKVGFFEVAAYGPVFTTYQLISRNLNTLGREHLSLAMQPQIQGFRRGAWRYSATRALPKGALYPSFYDPNKIFLTLLGFEAPSDSWVISGFILDDYRPWRLKRFRRVPGGLFTRFHLRDAYSAPWEYSNLLKELCPRRCYRYLWGFLEQPPFERGSTWCPDTRIVRDTYFQLIPWLSQGIFRLPRFVESFGGLFLLSQEFTGNSSTYNRAQLRQDPWVLLLYLTIYHYTGFKSQKLSFLERQRIVRRILYSGPFAMLSFNKLLHVDLLPRHLLVTKPLSNFLLLRENFDFLKRLLVFRGRFLWRIFFYNPLIFLLFSTFWKSWVAYFHLLIFFMLTFIYTTRPRGYLFPETFSDTRNETLLISLWEFGYYIIITQSIILLFLVYGYYFFRKNIVKHFVAKSKVNFFLKGLEADGDIVPRFATKFLWQPSRRRQALSFRFYTPASISSARRIRSLLEVELIKKDYAEMLESSRSGVYLDSDSNVQLFDLSETLEQSIFEGILSERELMEYYEDVNNMYFVDAFFWMTWCHKGSQWSFASIRPALHSELQLRYPADFEFWMSREAQEWVSYLRMSEGHDLALYDLTLYNTLRERWLAQHRNQTWWW